MTGQSTTSRADREAVERHRADLRLLGALPRFPRSAVDRSELERAVARGSFEAMRAHEARVAGDGPRVNRRGEVDQWREWIDDEDLAARFREPDPVDTAARLGHRLRPLPVRVRRCTPT